MRKILFLICFGFFIYGAFHWISDTFFSEHVEIPKHLTYDQTEYESTDSYIQTNAIRPKPEFVPTGNILHGNEYGDLEGGEVFLNPENKAIYIKHDASDPPKYVLYRIN